MIAATLTYAETFTHDLVLARPRMRHCLDFLAKRTRSGLTTGAAGAALRVVLRS